MSKGEIDKQAVAALKSFKERHRLSYSGFASYFGISKSRAYRSLNEEFSRGLPNDLLDQFTKRVFENQKAWHKTEINALNAAKFYYINNGL